MDNYVIYVGVAIATILLPGPAVMLTINNSIQRGLFKSLAGIFGIALAILLVAIISATSLGIILASSAMAFTAVKMIGAVYLIYLGIKMWRTKEVNHARSNHQKVSFLKCFTEGFLVSISNPKAVIFFMSIFPQFINLSQEYRPQFILLSVTFSMLVIVIHTVYALFSSFAKSKLSSTRGNVLLNKVSGGVFVGFGIGLATSSR
ncbi:lysine transporter LysE [Zobellella endophytica]|uniref:Lysine transporter LysE n=1 Tax=Zobellella endophytica TaxID=2116700 RepID=A0A2P7RB61_9GAMM|nr:LysE family translocator [Zobellella endophytica]PSJ47478.1 lysine transporter LysE [Zobellella endophytica]